MRLRTLVRDRYGRKKGLVRHVFHLAKLGSGLYGRYASVDWGRVERLVFVCQGNICRSSYAEARAETLGLSAISFGLGTEGGDAADPVAVRVASERDVTLAAHRSRTATMISFRPTDLILAMEPRQAFQLARAGAGSVQVSLLGLWCRHRRPHLEDPFGLSDEYFRTCFGIIDEAVETLALRLGRRATRAPVPCLQPEGQTP